MSELIRDDLNVTVAADAGCAASAARPPRRDAMGLSTSHIRPQRSDMWQVNVYDGGSLVEVHSPGGYGSEGGGKRGVIRRFSEASRRRLLRALSRTRRDQLPVFITLTYPDGFPGDPRVWKGHLKAWFKRLRREHPDAAGFWKLELKARQSGLNQGEIAPHFHLLLWGLPEAWDDPNGGRIRWEFCLQTDGLVGNRSLRFWKRERFRDGEWCGTEETRITEDMSGFEVVNFTSERQDRRGRKVRVVESYYRDGGRYFDKTLDMIVGENRAGEVRLLEWVSLTWAEVVGSDDPRHVRSGTRVEQIHSREGVMFYASKYVCKLDTEAIGNAGRFWGVHNVQAIPWAEVVNVPMDRRQAVRVMRVARRYIWAGQRLREHPRKIHWRAGCGMAFFCDASSWLQRLSILASG